jgi:hypothetical protein
MTGVIARAYGCGVGEVSESCFMGGDFLFGSVDFGGVWSCEAALGVVDPIWPSFTL